MTATAPLVLSLFPGVGLLDMAFEEAGFCVVRGPDLLWGGDVRRFHPPAGKFDGIIGGPPCKHWSPLANVVRAVHGPDAVAPDLIPEYERCVREAQPAWFLMENVPRAPTPNVDEYALEVYTLNNRWFGAEQNRVRRFSWGVRWRDQGAPQLHIEQAALEAFAWEPTVTSNAGGRRAVFVRDANGRSRGGQAEADYARLSNRPVTELSRLQGLPADFLEDSPFTAHGKRETIGNGVPLPMGRAVAAAVRRAMYPDWQLNGGAS